MSIKAEKKCSFVGGDGEQCKAMPLTNDEFCFWHSTKAEVVAECQKARSKGGKMSRRHLSGVSGPKTLQQAADLLADVIAGTLNGELDPRLASTVGTALKTLLKAFEVLDLAKRLSALESQSKGA